MPAGFWHLPPLSYRTAAAAKQKIAHSRLNQNKCRNYRSCKAPLSVYSLIVVQVKNAQLRLARCHILCSGGSYTNDQDFEYKFF